MYGKKIKQLRKNAGLKQADLAKLVGVSRPNISFWENADYPPLEAINKICKVLGMELWRFFSEDPPENQLRDIPSKYADLINEISQLSKGEYDDLLEIISIYLRKNKTTSSQYPTITEPDIDKALINYTERYLRIM
jgi:transcriptional regulator with XRE-family HTH domain